MDRRDVDYKNLLLQEPLPLPERRVSIIGTILFGDGRNVVHCPANFKVPDTTPMPMRRSAARRIVQEFLRSGRIYHSRQGATAWAIALFCVQADISYELLATSERGNPDPRDSRYITGFISILRSRNRITLA